MKYDNPLFLVNDENPLPLWYNVDTCEVADGYCLERTASCYARKMLCCACKCGICLKIESAYRSTAYQQMLIDNDIKMYMQKGLSLEKSIEETMKYLAKAGCSEHNAGLALDILSNDYTQMDDGFANTKAYKWLINNSYKYGFILRYPENKVHITKIGFEPWHYRYVGIYHAKKIKKNGITLEEYLKTLK